MLRRLDGVLQRLRFDDEPREPLAGAAMCSGDRTEVATW
jgi:hypothetical protein